MNGDPAQGSFNFDLLIEIDHQKQRLYLITNAENLLGREMSSYSTSVTLSIYKDPQNDGAHGILTRLPWLW
ncbi:4142_t:CDS:2 [Funneliformis mosseae]|uniref:4142_t:CDS:1 n=1 Tax=Funneliformis mosseae TaxID=27381 RepID=A0A9N8V4L0_FUNMO|nr:4142_t:CDS:2 [Funneliformis mosseae]